MILATQADVETRLGRDLTPAEEARLDGLLEEASALVEGYLGVTYTEDDVIPAVVVVVVSKIVARAITADPETMAVAAMQESSQAGPFSTRFRDNNVWFSKSDKLMLRRVGGGFTSVRLVSDRYEPGS